jgi:spore coat polysaccharide biosynthesis protein SpsF
MIVIIQARMNSSRFKQKVMYEVKEKPLIWYVINSIKKSRKIKKIIIATSKNKTDDKLCYYLKKNKISVFRGNLNNVAERLYSLASKLKLKNFIRISGDSPFMDYKIIDRAINIHRKKPSKYDLITNIFPRTFPRGRSVEIIKTNSLKKILPFINKDEKEHVTKFFYKNKEQFCIKNFKTNKKNLSNLAIDTKKDLEKLRNRFK